MGRPRLSYGLTIDQILDFLTDCSKQDLLYVVTKVMLRKAQLQSVLQSQRAQIDEHLSDLEKLAPQTLPAAPVVPE